MIAQFSTGEMERGQNSRERHGTGALNVVVESAGLIAVAGEQAEGVAVAEIFKLHQHAREILFNGDHEFLNERVISFTANPFLPQTGVERIVQQRLVVGANVNGDGQTLCGMNAGTRSVERQLADRNAHAGSAEIAEAKNAFPVRDDDHSHIARRPIMQHLFNLSGIFAGNIESA